MRVMLSLPTRATVIERSAIASPSSSSAIASPSSDSSASSDAPESVDSSVLSASSSSLPQAAASSENAASSATIRCQGLFAWRFGRFMGSLSLVVRRKRPLPPTLISTLLLGLVLECKGLHPFVAK